MSSEVMVWESVGATRVKKTLPTLKNHSATLVGSRIFIFGGFDGNKSQNIMYILDCASYTWKRLKNIGLYKDPSGSYIAPSGRNGHTATLIGSDIYIIGGWVEDIGEASSEVWKFDTIGYTWTRLETKRSICCNMHTTVYLPERKALLVMRGGDGLRFLNDLHLLHLDTLEWELIIPNGRPPAPRANLCSEIVGAQVFFFGGWNETKHFRDIHVLNTRTEPFEWFSPTGLRVIPSTSTGASLVALNDFLYLFGGVDNTHSCLNLVSVFDTKAMKWIETDLSDVETSSRREQRIQREAARRAHNMANPLEGQSLTDSTILGTAPSARTGHSATVVGRKILIFGGSNNTKMILNDIYFLDTDSPLALNEPKNSYTVHMGEYFNSEVFSDIIFEAEGKQLFAHKLILSMKSERFRNQFSSKGFNDRAKLKLKVADTSFEIFFLLLTFIYKDELPTFLSTDLIKKQEKPPQIDSDIFELERLSNENIDDLFNDRKVSMKSFATVDDFLDENFENKEGNRDIIVEQTETMNYLKETVNFEVYKTVLDLLYASDLYMVGGLKNKLENILQRIVTIETVDLIEEHAKRCNAQQLNLFCENFRKHYVK